MDKINIDEVIILKSAGVFKIKDKTSTLLLLEHMEVDSVPAFRKKYPSTKIIHWIANNSQTQTFTIVMYDRLLTNNDEINPKSKVIYS